MKKLLYIILLLPLWVNAQTNGTIQKTSATGTIRGSFGSLGLDTLPRVTGALVDGYILKYHAATNKWYASPDPVDSLGLFVKKTGDTMTGALNGTDIVLSGTLTANSIVKTGGTGAQFLMGNGSTQDTTTIQTVSNFFPKGDTRYAKLSSGFVNSITGTTNQVIASASTGSVTLSLPQSIATSSTPTFGGLTLTGSLTGTNGFFKSSATASEPFRVKYSGNTNNIFELYEYSGGIRSEMSLRDGSGNPTTRFDTGGNNFINGGNLGVGTTTPSAKLVVSNNNALGYEIDPTAASGTKIQTFSYNRATSAFKEIENFALSHKFFTGASTLALTLGGSQELIASSLAGSGDVIAGANNGGQIGKITIGSGLSLTSGVLTATGGSSGTVTTAGGTSGIIAKFTSASNIENSSLTEASGNLYSSGNLTIEGGSSRIGRTTPSSNGSSYLEMVNSNSVTNWRIATNFNHAGEFELNPSTAAGGSTFTTSPFRLNPSGNLVLAGTSTATSFSGAGTGLTGTASGLSIGGNAATATNSTQWNTAQHDFGSGIRTLPITSMVGKYSDGSYYQFAPSSVATYISGQTMDIVGNSSTATALQTARNIQGVSFNGTADINPINGTGFVKATGTTLSYDNSTYLTTSSASSTYAPISSPTFTGTVSGITAAMVGAPSGSGTSSGTNTGDQTWTTLSGKPTFATVATSGAYSDLSGTPSLSGYAPLASPALTGNPTAPTQTQGDNSTKIATTAYVDRLGGGTATSGTYTPTITGVSNLASSSAVKCHYIRVGNEVTITGRFTISSTTSSNVVLRISLPIASNLSATGDLSGSGSTEASSVGVYVIEDTTNDEAEFHIATNSTTFVNVGIGFTLSYTVK